MSSAIKWDRVVLIARLNILRSEGVATHDATEMIRAQGITEAADIIAILEASDYSAEPKERKL